MKQATSKILIFIIIACFVGGGFLFWLTSRETRIRDQESNLPAGIEVIEQGDKKIVRNTAEGYEVKVPKEWRVYSRNVDRIDIQNFEKPPEAYSGIGGEGCVASLSKKEKFQYSTINEWANEHCFTNPDCESYIIENIIDGKNREWQRVKFFGTFVGTGTPLYKIKVQDTVYTVRWDCSEESFAKENEDFLKTILTEFNFE